MPMLDFSTFSDYLSHAVTVWKKMDDYKDIFTPEWISDISLLDDVVELLELAMNDEDHWIGYWLFEQNCGEDWDDATACDADGHPIILKTQLELYLYLAKEYNGDAEFNYLLS